jgi:hypothetical protein
MAAATTERRCYNRRRRLLPSTPAAATIDASGCYHRRRRLLPSMPAAATIDAGVCYHRSRRLILSGGGDISGDASLLLAVGRSATSGEMRCYLLRDALLQAAG